MKLSLACSHEIEAALDQYRRVVEKTDLTAKTKKTYLLHAENFVRWLDGKFEPGGRKK